MRTDGWGALPGVSAKLAASMSSCLSIVACIACTTALFVPAISVFAIAATSITASALAASDC